MGEGCSDAPLFLCLHDEYGYSVLQLHRFNLDNLRPDNRHSCNGLDILQRWSGPMEYGRSSSVTIWMSCDQAALLLEGLFRTSSDDAELAMSFYL